MPNLFSINVITSAGAALIAQATAANQIVFVAALSKASAATDAANLAGQPASWYDGHVGRVVSVSAEGAVARIIAAFPATGSRQALKSACITARLASQTDSQAVPVAALSDDASTITLPGADDVGQAVEIPFNIAIGPQQQSVEVTPGASASISDLDRFVSLHAPGDPTRGVDQSILGAKTFSDKLSALGDVSVGGDLDVLYNSTFAGTVETFDDVSVGGTLRAGAVQASSGAHACTLDGSGLDIRSRSALTVPRTQISSGGLTMHNASGNTMIQARADTGALSAVTLSGLLTSLYGGSVGALVDITISGTGPDGAITLDRASTVYDGLVVSGVTLSVSSPDIPVVAGDKFVLLHRYTPTVSGGSFSGLVALAILTEVAE